MGAVEDLPEKVVEESNNESILFVEAKEPMIENFPVDEDSKLKNECSVDLKTNQKSKALHEQETSENKNNLEDDDFEDETIMERIKALSEIFPPGLTKGVAKVGDKG